jgi:cellobiose-specific phosphotransferase system component IIA
VYLLAELLPQGGEGGLQAAMKVCIHAGIAKTTTYTTTDAMRMTRAHDAINLLHTGKLVNQHAHQVLLRTVMR